MPPRTNATTIAVDGRCVQTLNDLLPESPGLNVLFVGKTPAPESVQIGHYFQGQQRRQFWKLLREYGIFEPTTEFEDDSLLSYRYGLTDIAKVPRPFREEPSPAEYKSGARRVMELVRMHQPRVIVFVYKKVLDTVARLEFGVSQRSSYGFNRGLEPYFRCRVFAFPLPGTPCGREQAKQAMQQLARACAELKR
jgi:mismatch-specific thymine-DNA glycosylase